MTMSHTNINTFGGVDFSNACVRSKQFGVPSDETMATFQPFHPLSKVDFPLFVNDFHLKTKVISHYEAFFFVSTCSPHLISNSLSSMVYELL